MQLLQLGLRASAALGVMLGLSGTVFGQGYVPPAPYCGPYGHSYMHPIYPYGNYPGYPNTPGGVFAHFGTQALPSYPWPPYPLKFREDAYAPGEMYPWGLQPDPAQSKPKGVPYEPEKPKKAPAAPKPAPDDVSSEIGVTAKVVVQVPVADAKVLVQGVAMKTTGVTRNFVTPPLSGNGPFRYKIEAVWTESGEVQSQSKWLEVKPGNSNTIVFGH